MLLMLKRCVHVVDAALYRVSDPNGDCFSAVSQVTALGLPPGPAYRKLKEGSVIVLPNGTVIRPEDVVGPPCVGRKVSWRCFPRTST